MGEIDVKGGTPKYQRKPEGDREATEDRGISRREAGKCLGMGLVAVITAAIKIRFGPQIGKEIDGILERAAERTLEKRIDEATRMYNNTQRIWEKTDCSDEDDLRRINDFIIVNQNGEEEKVNIIGMTRPDSSFTGRLIPGTEGETVWLVQEGKVYVAAFRPSPRGGLEPDVDAIEDLWDLTKGTLRKRLSQE